MEIENPYVSVSEVVPKILLVNVSLKRMKHRQLHQVPPRRLHEDGGETRLWAGSRWYKLAPVCRAGSLTDKGSCVCVWKCVRNLVEFDLFPSLVQLSFRVSVCLAFLNLGQTQGYGGAKEKGI